MWFFLLKDMFLKYYNSQSKQSFKKIFLFFTFCRFVSINLGHQLDFQEIEIQLEEAA